MTNVDENRVPFTKPANYDPLRYELLLRNFEAGDLRVPYHSLMMPNGKTDTNNNGKIDQRSKWQVVRESYDCIDGFSKQIAKMPAQLDLSQLPDGYGFQIELRVKDSTENKSKPMIDGLELAFD